MMSITFTGRHSGGFAGLALALAVALGRVDAAEAAMGLVEGSDFVVFSLQPRTLRSAANSQADLNVLPPP